MCPPGLPRSVSPWPPARPTREARALGGAARRDPRGGWNPATPRGGPAMAARSLPTSAQGSFWFKDKQTAWVSCGHPLWTVQPPTASAVLGTTALSPAPPDDPGASSPLPWSRRTDAVSRGPLHSASAWSSAVKAAAPPDAAWPLSWPSGQKQPDASQLHRPRTCASARPASSKLRGLVSVMENSENQGRQSPDSKWGATSMHKEGLVRVKDAEQALSVLVHARTVTFLFLVCHYVFTLVRVQESMKNK